MRPALDPAGHRVSRTKPTCLLHTWRPHRRRPFALVLHLHQHQSSRNLHLQYLAKNQSTRRCQSLITQGSDHPPVLEPHMVLTALGSAATAPRPAAAPRHVVWGERRGEEGDSEGGGSGGQSGREGGGPTGTGHGSRRVVGGGGVKGGMGGGRQGWREAAAWRGNGRRQARWGELNS
jgi:uncharacterized membrane protein YgcG